MPNPDAGAGASVMDAIAPALRAAAHSPPSTFDARSGRPVLTAAVFNILAR